MVAGVSRFARRVKARRRVCSPEQPPPDVRQVVEIAGLPASLAVGFLLQRTIGSVQLHIARGAVLLLRGVLGALTAEPARRAAFFAVAGVGMFLPVAPLATLLQRQPGMTAANVGMVRGTVGSVTCVVSAVAPNAVGDFVAGGASIASLLMPCGLLGLAPVVAPLLPEPRR